MRKFHFRLDFVLRLRSLHLVMERDKLGQALAAVTRAEQAISALSAERAAAVLFVQTDPAAGSSELHALSAYLLGYEARLSSLQKSLEAARLRAAEQRQRVLAADRDERLLLKLKAKQRAAWQADADHELETLAQESWNAVHFNRDL
jgi:flagellar export protein FliJ